MSVDPIDARGQGQSELQRRSHLGQQGALSLHGAPAVGRDRVSVSRGGRNLLHQAAGRTARRSREDLARRHLHQGSGDNDFVSQHKPPRKCGRWRRSCTTTITVSQELLEHNWPLRRKVWSKQDSPGDWQPSEDARTRHTTAAARRSWLRYQHIVPPRANWQEGPGRRAAAGRRADHRLLRL